MTNLFDLRPYEPRATSAPPFPTDDRCWYRYFGLNPFFQRFIIPDLSRYDSASCVINREVYVATELLHFHSAEDTDWLHDHGFPAHVSDPDPANATAPRPTPELYRWWPLEKLEAKFIRFLLVEIADDRSQSRMIDGKLYVDRELVASYAAGDTDWLYEAAHNYLNTGS